MLGDRAVGLSQQITKQGVVTIMRTCKCFFLWIILCIPNLFGQAPRQEWIAFDGKVKAGTPIQAVVLKTSKDGTTYELRVPGVWLETTTYAGRSFTRLLLPAVQLSGQGFPQRAGERGWFDFPAETGQPLRDPDAFVNGLGVGIPKPIFPEAALRQKPQTATEMEKLGINPAGARPGIPAVRGFVAVSRANQKGDLDLQFSGGSMTLQLPFPLAPAGFEGSDQIRVDNNGYIPPQLIDEEFYGSFKGAYRGTELPLSEVSGAGAGFATVETHVPLVEVANPQVIKVFTNLVVSVKHLKGTEDFDCPISWDAWTCIFPFINGAALRESFTVKGLSIEKSRSAHYLIVTPKEYRSDLNAFALWKQSKGLNVDFAYMGTAAGSDVAPDRTAIDAYLEAYFRKNYCHGVYVLLIGDVDVIPSGRSTRVTGGPDGADADSDHVYEVLGNDRFPSLYVGRLSINSSAELKVQLQKILSYERDPAPGDWPTKATLAANSQNDDASMGVSASFPSKYAAAVNAIASYGSYSSPPTFQKLHAGAASAAVVRAVNADVISAVNEGRGQVLYRGHGGGTTWTSGWDGSSSSGTPFSASAHLPLLNNKIYPIVYSIACQNGRLRNTEAISESWMSRTNGGAVAHFGASVNSWTDENHERAKGIFRALYESGFTRLGPALAEAERISHSVTGGGDAWDSNTFAYNLLGDPELTVRKKTVFRFNLVGLITNLNTTAVIRVRDEQGATPENSFAFVTLHDGSVLNGFANVNGDVVLNGTTPSQVAFVDLQADGYKAGRVANPKPVRQWIALDPNATPGSPITSSLSAVTQSNTIVKLHIPGVWVNVSQYGGRDVATLEFPNLSSLTGPGIPQKPGERGWFDFPEKTGIAPLAPERFQHPFEQGIYQPVFPKAALGKAPRTEKELIAAGVDPAGARPGIPTLRGFLAVARGTTAQDMSIDFANSTQKPITLPAPLRPAGFTGSDQAVEIFGYDAPELFDEEFYAKFPAPYRGPEKPLDRAGSVGAFGVAEMHIPLAELVSANLANVYVDIFVNVKHLKGTEDFTCPFSWDSWYFNMPFINGQALRDAMTVKGIAIEGSRSAHYLILTPRIYRNTLNEFALWKQAKGLNVDFAYVGAAAGDDVAADRNAIDAYIESYFKVNYCHGVYVLIVGDVDVIPSGRSTRVDSDPDGNDADSDHIYEVLGSDRFPSLYVGRLSINSEDELKTQLAKILSYERAPASGDWPTRTTLAANSQNDDGSMGVSASFPSKYAAAVNAVAGYGGYSSPPTFQVLHAGASSAAATRAVNQDVVNAIHVGRGIVLYRGHGSGTGWVSGWDGSSSSGTSFSQAHVNSLTNSAYPIVFSIACQNGRLRNNDAISETWLSRVNGGAVAHFGASVNSYTSENHERAKGLFRALYESGFTRLGPALAEGERISYSSTGGGSGWDNNTFCYNLLGDPELTVRKRAILRFNLAALITNINSAAVIRVFDEQGTPAPGSFVLATLLDGRTINGFANPNGELALAGIPASQVATVDLQADGYRAARISNTRPTRQWIALDPNATAGSPITSTISEVTQSNTIVKLHIPGVWVNVTQYAGKEVATLEFPNLASLTGPGIPQKPGERGWFDFPEKTGIAPLPPERFQHPFEQGIYQPVFPKAALGKVPQSEREMIAAGIDPAGARPGIPTLRGFLAVARGTSAQELSIDFSKSTQKVITLPAPLRPAGFTGSDQAAEIFGYDAPELFDEEFYGKFPAPYRGPEKPLDRAGSVGAFGVAEMHLPLVELVSANLANFYVDLLVSVKHLKGTEDFTCPFSWDSWLFNMPFINGQALRDAMTVKGIEIEGSRSAHYLILTQRIYRNALNEFALWKQAKGLNVDFAYVGAAAGDDVAADRNAIDAYIESYFKVNYCHGVYVLIVGDVDVVPSGRSTRVDSDPDGNDADSDHIYEVLGSDRFPSLYVGRLSINSEDELKTQLAKILSYERAPASGDWPTRTTLAANSQNDDGSMGVSASFPSKYAAAVNAVAGYGGYSSPPTFQVLHAGASSAATTRAVNQDVVNAIHAGRGIVLYRGHGSGTGWVSGWDGSSSSGTSFSQTHVNSLTNSAYPIVFSIACQNGRLRNNDAISETWLSRANGGAVAHFGASVNSYTSENHERAKGLFRALYEGGFTRLGPALAEGERISYSSTGGGSGWDNNTFCYNLLGDPELTVRKRPVLRFNLAALITNINAAAVIRVFDEQGTVAPGSFVLATLLDGRTINGFANPNGELALPGIPASQVATVDLQADGYRAARISNAQPTRQWIALDTNAKPGTPVSASIVGMTQTETSLRLHIPGVWIHISQFGGKEVATLEFPELDKLIGAGIPQKPGERGWFDFPESTGISPLSPARYQHPFEQGMFKPVYPKSALGKNPKTEREMIAAGLDPAGARPGIPTLRGFLAVSRASSPEDLSIDLGNSTQKEVALPAPLRPAGFTGSDQATDAFGYTPPELFDEEFYASFKGAYRGTEKPIDPAGSVGAFGVAEVTIPLVEVTTANLAKVYVDLLISVKHLKGTEDFVCPFSWDSWLFHLPFINGAALRAAMTVKGIAIQGSRSAHYLILTPRVYRNALNEFALWKQSKGLNVDFAYVGSAAGDDVAADRNAIDGYLESYFKANYCHGVYVLIVGDVDVVPSGRSTRVDSDPDGNDADSDHIYEVLGSNRFPSLYVGRLSINSESELSTQLGKILSYERSPVAGDWPTKVTLAANSQNDDGSRGVSPSFPSKYAAAVNAVAGYGSYTAPPSFQVLHAGASSAAATRAVNQDVVDAINGGRGIVLYRGHGDGSGWVSGWDGSSTFGLDFTTSHINALTNHAYPIVLSIACQNGRLRNKVAISELWMSRANAGAVAHFGASVNSYTDENHERAKGLFRAIYENGFTRLGPALAEGERISYSATGGGAGWDNNTFCYNLLGDPELTIRKQAVPFRFSVIPVLALVQNLGTTITLKDSLGGVVSNALVNVILANQGHTNLFTGPNGSLLLSQIKPEEISLVQVHAEGYPFIETDFGTPVRALLSAIGFGRAGEFNLSVEASGGSWIVQASSDFRTWVDLGTIGAGGVQLSDPDAPKFKYRFYRAVAK
ncbi:MAG: hypothetical protein EXS30_06155 [Pedosphaera sp.]|nr:hypothetical protein [Pedosphaera sp.]